MREELLGLNNEKKMLLEYTNKLLLNQKCEKFILKFSLLQIKKEKK